MGNQIISLCSCENSEKGKKELESNLINARNINPQFEEMSSNSALENFNPRDVKSVAKSIIETFLDNKKESETGTHWESSSNDENKNKVVSPAIEHLCYEDGSSYKGEVSKGLKNGQGRLFKGNGNLYIGKFQNDNYEGYGKLKENDTTYEGMFSKGLKNGQGVQIKKDCNSRYEGEWKDNLKCGQGIEHYSDGSIYLGSFYNNKKHGKGKLTLSNGSYFEGDFLEGNLDGNGYFKGSGTQSYQGGFKDNCFSGLGCLKRGYFFSNKKHGYGVSIHLKTNTSIIGSWTENVMEGLAVYSSDKGEQLWKMKKNKLLQMITEEYDIEAVKTTEEFAKLQSFYTMVNQVKKEFNLILTDQCI